MQAICACCGDFKLRKMRLTGGGKYGYYDDEGGKWRGNHCATCVPILNKKNPNAAPKRQCKGCSKTLPADRWWHCLSCRVLYDEGDDCQVYLYEDPTFG